MTSKKELIAKIKTLESIQPRQDWVVLTKRELFEERVPVPVAVPSISFWETILRFLFQPKLVIACFAVGFILLGALYFPVKNSLPGDNLYLLKKAYEKSRVVFVSNSRLVEVQLDLAGKRLDDLEKIAKNNQIQNLNPALQEYQATIAEAAKGLVRVVATTSDPVEMKKLAAQIQKLEENKDNLERVYGMSGLEAGDDFNPTKMITLWLISDLEQRTLTQEQAATLSEAKADFEAGFYNAALEKILGMK